MKRVLILLALFASMVTTVDAKVKTIRNFHSGTYKGEVDELSMPHGKGVLKIGNGQPRIEIRGVFSTNNVTLVRDAIVTLPGNSSFKGTVLLDGASFSLSDGGLYDEKGVLLGTIPFGDHQLVRYYLMGSDLSKIDGPFVIQGPSRSIPEKKIKDYIAFAGDASYTANEPLSGNISTSGLSFYRKPDYYEVVFSNGAKITINDNGTEEWTKPAGKDGRGDYLQYRNDRLLLFRYCLHFGDDYVYADTQKGEYFVKHRFSNGNIYEGPVLEDFSYTIAQDALKSHSLLWVWSDFYKWVLPGVYGGDTGTIIYADGSRYEGSFKGCRTPYVGSRLSEDCFYTGTFYDSNNNVIKRFKSGIDEAQKETLLAQATLREAQEKKELEDNIEREYKMLCDKYGTKYVDALLNHQILVGTPEEFLLNYIYGSYEYIYYKEYIRNYFLRKYELYYESASSRRYYLYSAANDRIDVDIDKWDGTVSRVVYH